MFKQLRLSDCIRSYTWGIRSYTFYTFYWPLLFRFASISPVLCARNSCFIFSFVLQTEQVNGCHHFESSHGMLVIWINGLERFLLKSHIWSHRYASSFDCCRHHRFFFFLLQMKDQCPFQVLRQKTWSPLDGCNWKCPGTYLPVTYFKMYKILYILV